MTTKTKKDRMQASTFEKDPEQTVIADTATQVAQDAPTPGTYQEASPAAEAPAGEPAATDVPPASKRGRKPKAETAEPTPVGGLTMRGLADGFIAALQAKGAGLGTV